MNTHDTPRPRVLRGSLEIVEYVRAYFGPGVSRHTVRHALATGALPRLAIEGRVPVVLTADVDGWLLSLRPATADTQATA